MPWSDYFVARRSPPPPMPIQRPRTPALVVQHSGWLSGRVLLRLQEGADRVALKPVAQAAQKLNLAMTDGDNWTLLWSYKPPWDVASLDNKRRQQAGPNGGYLVNHLPGTIWLASKVHLVKFSVELAAKLPRIFGAITPET